MNGSRFTSNIQEDPSLEEEAFKRRQGRVSVGLHACAQEV